MDRVFINTRPKHQTEKLTKGLSALNLSTIELPLLEIHQSPVIDYLPRVIETLDADDWIIFSSANGVSNAFDYLKNIWGESFYTKLDCYNFSAIGEKTAAKIQSYGLEVKFVPKNSNSNSFAKELIEFLQQRKKANVLLLRGQLASSILPDELKNAGFEVKDFFVYQTKRIALSSESEALLREVLLNTANKYVLIFTSAEGIRAFIDSIGKIAHNISADVNKRIKELDFVAIGGETAACLRNHFIQASIISQKQSIENLLEEIKLHYCGEK